MQGPPYYNPTGIPRSSWLAVDASGCLGMFASGEGGAVPMPWPLGTSPGEFTPDRFPLDALRAGRVVDGGRSLGAGRARIGERAVVSFEDAESAATYRSGPRPSAFETEIGAARVRVLRESGPRVIATLRPLDGALVAALAREPARVVSAHELVELLASLVDTGVYTFRNDGIAGEYERTDVPGRPIREDELPEPARSALCVVRFAILFSAVERLQLADHFPRADLVTRGPGDVLRRPS